MHIRVFAANLVGLGLLWSVSYIKSQPTKNYLVWEKVAQMPTLTNFFLGLVGLVLGSSTVSYYYYLVSNPTKCGKSRTAYHVGRLVAIQFLVRVRC